MALKEQSDSGHSAFVVAGNQKPKTHLFLSTTKTSAGVNRGHFISSSLALESRLKLNCCMTSHMRTTLKKPGGVNQKSQHGHVVTDGVDTAERVIE